MSDNRHYSSGSSSSGHNSKSSNYNSVVGSGSVKKNNVEQAAVGGVAGADSNPTYNASVTIQLGSRRNVLPTEISIKRDIRKYFEFKQILGT